MQVPKVPDLSAEVSKLEIPNIELPDVPKPSRWTLFWLACACNSSSSSKKADAPTELKKDGNSAAPVAATASGPVGGLTRVPSVKAGPRRPGGPVQDESLSDYVELEEWYKCTFMMGNILREDHWVESDKVGDIANGQVVLSVGYGFVTANGFKTKRLKVLMTNGKFGWCSATLAAAGQAVVMEVDEESKERIRKEKEAKAARAAEFKKFEKFVDDGETVILTNNWDKESGGLAGFQPRQLILTDKPKLYYVDMSKASKGKEAVKGTLDWTPDHTPRATFTGMLHILALDGKKKERDYVFAKQTAPGDVTTNPTEWVTMINSFAPPELLQQLLKSNSIKK